MKRNQFVNNRRLNLSSESNREKHINSPGVEEDSSKNTAINKGTSERQTQWQQEIEEGEREKSRRDDQQNSVMPMDNDETIGVP